jgi:hypothetical protein
MFFSQTPVDGKDFKIRVLERGLIVRLAGLKVLYRVD